MCVLCPPSQHAQADWQPVLRRANIPLAQVEVRFQDLSVDADIAVGSSGLPSVYNTYKNMILVRSPAVCEPAALCLLLGSCRREGPPSTLPSQMQPSPVDSCCCLYQAVPGHDQSGL